MAKYFNTLSSDDISRRYFNGEKYESTMLSRLRMFFSTDSILADLNKFYPYQPMVKRTVEWYEEKSKTSHNVALGVSLLGM